MLSCIRAEHDGNMLEILNLGNLILKAISYSSKRKSMEDEVMNSGSSSAVKETWKKDGGWAYNT
jgi:hypothetical protein